MIKLDDLQGGVLTEKINYELNKIFENILDPNTDETKIRKLSIALKFKPSKDREMVNLEPTLKVDLAPVEVESTILIVDKDISTGKVVAKEWNKQIAGQVSIEDVENEDKSTKIVDLMAK